MSATEALTAARLAGIDVHLDGGDLVLEAAASPSTAVLTLLSKHKAGIVALLRPDLHGWSADDWRAFFDERAGIAEFDGGLSPAEAEARAFSCCVDEWVNPTVARSAPGRCIGCDESQVRNEAIAALMGIEKRITCR